jgi:uncharacterized protein
MSVDRIFLDANILFSVAYGSPGLNRLWELAQKGFCVLLASEHIIEEAKRNLSATEQLQRLDEYLSIVHPVPEVDPTVTCPIDLPDKDRPVIMAAISAKAGYFITGDITHFGKYFGQTIMGVNICLARDYISTKIKL